MSDKNEPKIQKPTPKKKFDFEIKGVDIDKAEYQEIILSNSNHPDRDYYR